MVYLKCTRHSSQLSFVFVAPCLSRPLLEKRYSPSLNRIAMTTETAIISSNPSEQRRAPRTFVRLTPAPDADKLLLQTAVITYNLPNAKGKAPNKVLENPSAESQTIHIYSLLHFADPSYFDSLQSSLSALDANQKSQSVLFELLTSSCNILTQPYPRLKSRLIATPSARTTASSLGAVAQVDALDLSQPSWRHADLTLDDVPSSNEPITRPPSNPAELVFRMIFFALPFPELYAMFVDVAIGRAQLPIRTALATFTADGLTTARRLTFAAKMAALRYTSPTALDLRRNTAAWDAVRDTLTRENAPSEIALLYGAWHVGALCRCAETDGWSFKNIEWRTAMAVSAPPLGLSRLLPIIVTISAYATYSALDWVSLVARLGLALESAENRAAVGVEVLLYIVRHGAPYIAFWRWFRDWSFN